jgi:hypothetical protein
MADDFSLRYGDLLTGSYDCVDRIVLNAFYPLGYQPGGLRVWWRRWHNDGDEQLDNTHLMRLAGRFARRVKAWGAANDVPVIFCKAGERKHRIAEQYLAEHEVGIGVFLVLVAKAPAPVWKMARSAKTGAIVNIERRREYVNHYSFHIIDPEWGHVTIKMSGHPPVRRTDHPQRPRVRGASGRGGGDSIRQGRQLLHRGRRPGGPGPDRRCLVAACGCRAAEPGLPTLDLQRVPVLRA